MMEIGQPLWRDQPIRDSLTNRAIRLLIVPTIAEAASPQMRPEFAESLLESIAVDVPEPKAAHPRRVDQKPIAAQTITGRRRGRMTPESGRLRQTPDLDLLIGQ